MSLIKISHISRKGDFFLCWFSFARLFSFFFRSSAWAGRNGNFWRGLTNRWNSFTGIGVAGWHVSLLAARSKRPPLPKQNGPEQNTYRKNGDRDGDVLNWTALNSAAKGQCLSTQRPQLNAIGIEMRWEKFNKCRRIERIVWSSDCAHPSSRARHRYGKQKDEPKCSISTSAVRVNAAARMICIAIASHIRPKWHRHTAV